MRAIKLIERRVVIERGGGLLREIIRRPSNSRFHSFSCLPLLPGACHADWHLSGTEKWVHQQQHCHCHCLALSQRSIIKSYYDGYACSLAIGNGNGNENDWCEERHCQAVSVDHQLRLRVGTSALVQWMERQISSGRGKVRLLLDCRNALT